MKTPKTAWKPGESGNPKGRPKKGYSITEWFKEMLKSNPEIKDAMGKSILKKALEGDIAAQRLVWQYMDGMPQQKVEIDTPEDKVKEVKKYIDEQVQALGKDVPSK